MGKYFPNMISRRGIFVGIFVVLVGISVYEIREGGVKIAKFDHQFDAEPDLYKIQLKSEDGVEFERTTVYVDTSVVDREEKENEKEKKEIQTEKKGDLIHSWLHLPVVQITAIPTMPPPLVIMGPGLGAQKDTSLEEIAALFVKEGNAVLTFDYRCWGGSGGLPRHHVDPSWMIDDWFAIIKKAVDSNCFDYKCDANNIFLWGSSFGGGLVLSVASRLAKKRENGMHDHIRGILSMVPFVDGYQQAEMAAKGRPWRLSVRSALAIFADYLTSIFTSYRLYIRIASPKASTLNKEEEEKTGKAENAKIVVGTCTNEDDPNFDLSKCISAMRMNNVDFKLWHQKSPLNKGNENSKKTFIGNWKNMITARSILHSVRFSPMAECFDIEVPTLMLVASGDELVDSEKPHMAAQCINTFHQKRLKFYKKQAAKQQKEEEEAERKKQNGEQNEDKTEKKDSDNKDEEDADDDDDNLEEDSSLHPSEHKTIAFAKFVEAGHFDLYFKGMRSEVVVEMQGFIQKYKFDAGSMMAGAGGNAAQQQTSQIPQQPPQPSSSPPPSPPSDFKNQKPKQRQPQQQKNQQQKDQQQQKEQKKPQPQQKQSQPQQVKLDQ